MKKKYQFVAGIVFVLLLIGSMKSLWDIDVFVGALSTGSAVIVYGGLINSFDFYHAALIRLLFCVSFNAILIVALIIDKGGQL